MCTAPVEEFWRSPTRSAGESGPASYWRWWPCCRQVLPCLCCCCGSSPLCKALGQVVQPRAICSACWSVKLRVAPGCLRRGAGVDSSPDVAAANVSQSARVWLLQVCSGGASQREAGWLRRHRCGSGVKEAVKRREGVLRARLDRRDEAACEVRMRSRYLRPDAEGRRAREEWSEAEQSLIS